MANETIVIPITGAMHPSVDIRMPGPRRIRRRVLSTGEVIYSRLRRELSRVEGLRVESTIALTSFGIKHPEVLEEEITEQARLRLVRNPTSQAILVAHSMSGPAAASIVSRQTLGDQVIGAVANGSPFEGPNEDLLRNLWLIGKISGLFGMTDFSAFERDFPGYAAETRQSMSSREGRAGLHITGSAHDLIVPLLSATSAETGVPSYALCPNARHAEGSGATHTQTIHNVSHNGLIASGDGVRATVTLVRRIAGQALENEVDQAA